MHAVVRLESLWQDVYYAARSLRKSPGFLATVVLSLALGIGANSTIFSVIDGLMYRPLPYADAGRLLVIWETEQGRPESEEGPPIAELGDWNKQNHVFEDIALTSQTEAAPASRVGAPELIHVQYATPNFFSVLKTRPAMGRVFLNDEAQDRSQTVMISDSYWKRRFESDPHAIGKSFQISGVQSVVVGVMPPGFAPFYGGQIDAWVPINPESARYSERKDRGWLMPVGRLKPGATRGQAQTEMNVIARRLERAYPVINRGIRTKVVPLQEAVFGWVRQLYPLMGAVGFVLLIACLNVANLLQSRTETRRKEQAVRASLGAGRMRMVQQLLVESGLLALAGGAVGVAVAIAGIQLFLKLAGDFPGANSIRMDVRALVFTLAVSLVTALLVGLAPAIRGARPDLQDAMRAGEGTRVAGSRGWTRHALAVSEVALAMVLLMGAGLMINTMVRLSRVDPGFDARHVMMARIELPEGGKYVERIPGGDMEKATPQVTAFYRELLERASVMPGMESVGTMSGMARGITFSIMGRALPPEDKRPEAVYTEASPSWFRTLRIPLKKGRYFTDLDRVNTPWTAVINETFARRYFADQDPIGKRVLLRFESYHVDEERPREIVGVIGDVKQFGLGEKVPPMVFSSLYQQPAVFPGGAIVGRIWQWVVARVAPGSEAERDFAVNLKKLVGRLDADQPVTRIMTMNEYLAGSIEDWRFLMRLFETFAAIALLLAMVGIYGVMSYFVNERRREIGIRIALGAERASVLGLVTKLGLKLTLMGVGAGTAMAMGLARLITRFLFGVSPADPMTFAAVAAALTSVALVACYVPAHRAARVDPMVALRHE